MAQKTNAMRMLESQNVSYETYVFSPDVHSATGLAQVLGVPASHIYKSLIVMRKKGKPLVMLVPGDRELYLKGLAQAIGEKRLRMASYAEAESLTGLQVGGISALALVDRGFDVYMDGAAAMLNRVIVSAGCRGINLGIGVPDLTHLTNAKMVDGATKPSEP